MKEPPSLLGGSKDKELTVPTDTYANHYERQSTNHPDFESEFDINDYCYADADYEPFTNNGGPSSCTVPDARPSPSRSISQPAQRYPSPTNNVTFPYGTESYAEPSKPNHAIPPHMTSYLYEPQPPQYSEASEPPVNVAKPKPEHDQQSKYSPYMGHFISTQSASQYRKDATRFNRKPYREPDTDDTIAEVERDRLYHVERLYNAMTRGDAARDNKGSIAMKRWVHGAYYKADLVEAYAHKVLDCLLLQAKEGFRGWVHNDYVADERKGEDEDRDVTCEERLDSIIRALEEEKTICEDVMNSACQIRMFVNAPKAYANRKYQNRVGNSKRGRPKDSDVGEPSSKARKLNPKQAARTRRSVSNVPTEPSTQVRVHSRTSNLTALPQSHVRYTTPPYVNPGAPAMARVAPMYNRPHAQQRMYATSPLVPLPPPRASPLVRRESTMPPRQHTPLVSTPGLSHGHHSAPPSPDDATAAHDSEIDWSSIQSYGGAMHPSDAVLFDDPWRWPSGPSEQVLTGASANLFTVHPEAADKVLTPRQEDEGAFTGMSSLPSFWQQQHGVQPLPDLPTNPYADTEAGEQQKR